MLLSTVCRWSIETLLEGAWIK